MTRSVLLVGDYPPDPTLGSSKVFYKLQEEFRALGHRCDILFGDEIAAPRFRQMGQVISPWRAATAIGITVCLCPRTTRRPSSTR